MQAITFQGTKSVKAEAVPDPVLRGPRDAIVKVHLTAICGSDLHPYHGREPLKPGTVMGHEFLGEVVECGSAAKWRKGDLVVSPFTTNCGACYYCDRGLTARCPKGELFGGDTLPGGQAEYVRVPLADSTLVSVPDGANKEEALLAGDVLSTGFFVAEMGDVAKGSVVAVLGCGPVGLMAVLGARERGAGTVLSFDSIPERRKLAESFGARAFDLENPVEAVGRFTEGRGVDSVLEAVGSPEATRLAVSLVRPGGTIAAAGVHTEEHFAFSPGEAYDRNLTYRAGRCSARHFMEKTLSLVRDEKYELDSIVSHRLSLAEGEKGYVLFDQKKDGCTKVILTVS